MVNEYWGLRESPFRSEAALDYFFPGNSQEEALARLEFLIDGHRRAGLLTGEAGCGKSLLLEVLTRQLRRRGTRAVHVSLVGLSVIELLDALAAPWGVAVPRCTERRELWTRLCDALAAHRIQQLDTVLLLDDVDLATPEVHDALLRLAQLDPTPEARCTLLMAARTGYGAMPSRLLDLVELRSELAPWELSEMTRFVELALSAAGRSEELFTQPALERLYALSDGVPRRVATLADLCLAAGAGGGVPRIDAEIVDAACSQLAVAVG